jgi:hypothetical protein
MATVLRYIIVDEFLKGNGKMTSGMAMGMKFSRMEMFIMAPICKVSLMVKVSINGQMARSMMESGS